MIYICNKYKNNDNLILKCYEKHGFISFFGYIDFAGNGSGIRIKDGVLSS